MILTNLLLVMAGIGLWMMPGALVLKPVTRRVYLAVRAQKTSRYGRSTALPPEYGMGTATGAGALTVLAGPLGLAFGIACQLSLSKGILPEYQREVEFEEESQLQESMSRTTAAMNAQAQAIERRTKSIAAFNDLPGIRDRPDLHIIHEE